MRNVYLISHTESIHHVQKLGGGWYDTSLTEKGRVQAAKIATGLYNKIRLPGIPVYSSDLKRAMETADAFAKVFGSAIILDKNLREMNFGEYGGKTDEWWADNIIPLPTDVNRLDHRIFKGAESRRECGQRAYVFMDRLLSMPGENSIMITHGYFRTYLILSWLKVPVEDMGYAGFPAGSGSVTLLNEDGFGRRNMVYLNRMDFLNG